ncbi:MAG TPA: hypothetical protein VI977_06720 [archaeon]|nr:hypothetical protein [archaeon]
MALKELREKLKWLDPFTYVDLYLMPRINPSKNEYVSIAVYLVSAFVFAWLIYTALGFAFGTGSPMVIVMSGSMEPLYHRGDVIVLFGTGRTGVNAPEISLDVPSLKGVSFSQIGETIPGTATFENPIQAIKFGNGTEIPIQKNGSIVVYYSSLTQQPIIHRAVAKIHVSDGDYLLTKGDSIYNPTIDQDCGRISSLGTEKPCITLYPVPVKQVQGISVFQIPFVGCFKLWIFDDLAGLIGSGKLPADFKGVC